MFRRYCRQLKTVRLHLICIAALAIVIASVGSWLVASISIAPANRVIGDLETNLPIESFRIKSKSGSDLASWYVSNNESNATIVLLHPMRGSRRSMLGRMEMFYDAGFSLLAIDFQAHGESFGKYITFGHLEKFDAAAAIEFAKEKNPDHRIGVVGRSLGGASALLARPIDVDAMVLESVFPTIQDAVYNRVDKRVGWLKYLAAPALLIQLRPRIGVKPTDLCPIEYLSQLECPVLIAGGEKDLCTPISETKEMYQAANSPKRLVIFERIGHKDFFRNDREKYESDVLPFLIKHLQTERTETPQKEKSNWGGG